MTKSTLKFFTYTLFLLLTVQFAKAQCTTVYDTLTPTICAGDTFYFNGIPHTRSTGGFGAPVTDTVLLASGCDSITLLRLTVLRPITDSFTQSICTGNSYNFNGQMLTTTGIYKDTLTSILGCDSTVTINLTVGGAVTNSIGASICYGDSFLFNGTYLKTVGYFNDTVTSGGSCDSIVILHLTFLTMPTTTITEAYCQGGSYIFNGQTITTPGTYRDTIFFGAANGCDSIIRLNYFPGVVRVTRRDTICFADTLFIPGGFYILGSAGSHRYAPDTVLYSCTDSVFTYIITVDTPATPMISASGALLSETVAGFSSYQWELGGSNLSGDIQSTYTATQNGSYTVEAWDAQGCSSTSAPYNLTGVGIAAIADDLKVRLYPNPNSGSFMLQTANAIGSEAVIYDILGQSAGNISVTKDLMPIDLTLPSGIYVLKIKDNKGVLTSVKFTVSQ